MKNWSQSKKRWFYQGTSGILLFGAGTCMVVDAGFCRYAGGAWVVYGTVALVVLMAGLLLSVDAIRWKIYDETDQRK